MVQNTCLTSTIVNGTGSLASDSVLDVHNTDLQTGLGRNRGKLEQLFNEIYFDNDLRYYSAPIAQW